MAGSIPVRLRYLVEGSLIRPRLDTTRFEGGPVIMRIPVVSSLLARVVATMFRKGFRNLIAVAEERSTFR